MSFLVIGGGFCAATLHVHRSIGPKPVEATEISVMARDKVSLSAWWVKPAVSNGNCVMVLHGIADSKSSGFGFAPLFLRHGYSVLTPDNRAHGASGGKFVTYGLLERWDVIDWAHWMKEQGCVKLFGLGESLGASILIQATAVEPIFAAIVAECPYADLKGMAEYRMQQMLPGPHSLSQVFAKVIVHTGLLYARFVDNLDFRNVSPKQSMRLFSTPVLLIHGLDDRRTPPDQSKLLFAARPTGTALWLVPGASHTNASSVAPLDFQNRVIAWLANSYTEIIDAHSTLAPIR